MPDTEETKELLKALRNSRTKKIFESFDKESAGVMCFLRMLINFGRPVSAGEISVYMQVSTARVAVLIKKMEGKNFIEKTSDPNDARKTIVSITDNGRKKITDYDERMINFFSGVIDRVGVERFKEFTEISAEIKNAVEEEVKFHDVEFRL